MNKQVNHNMKKERIAMLHQSDLWRIEGEGFFTSGYVEPIDSYVPKNQYSIYLERRVKRLKAAILAYFHRQAIDSLNQTTKKPQKSVEAINQLYIEAREILLIDNPMEWTKSYRPDFIELLEDEDLKTIMRLNHYKIGGVC
ncbi:hypothetical protein ACFFHT_10625 [Gallibacterium melopsittaci]|uniref:Phage protein n=1 Tax=Gallibacterium melopsittaci TaxID=516063 RepID=A0ABV6HZH1_9PAST